jgi:hypothetical protein
MVTNDPQDPRNQPMGGQWHPQLPGQPGAQPYQPGAQQYQPPASGSQPPRGPSALGFGIAALRRMGPRQGQGGGRALRSLVFAGVGAVALVAIIAAVAGSGGGGGNQGSASAPVTPVRPAASSAPSQASSLSGPIGTVYQAIGETGSKMTVELTRIIDPAHAASQFTAPGNGKRFVGAVFTIKGVSGSFTGDANIDARLIGSNGQSYTADFAGLTEVTGFTGGVFTVSPGEHSVGAVTFQIPAGLKVARIQWSVDGVGVGAPAQWVIHS